MSEVPAQPAKSAAPKPKEISASEFLQTYSLYRKCRVEGDWAFPGRLQWDCDKCGKETTWALHNKGDAYVGFLLGIYKCVLCDQSSVRLYLFSADGKEICKIGQHPEPSIAIPKRLEKALSDSAEHYKKALICFNQGYGIAAVAYFRRVVEERTNELIDVVAESAKANGSSEAEVKKILLAKAERTYDKKLEVASQVLPTSLRPGGLNPLGTLHDLLSDRLHARSEEESLATAAQMRFIIEHVFSTLKEHIDAQRMYVQKIQNVGKN